MNIRRNQNTSNEILLIVSILTVFDMICLKLDYPRVGIQKYRRTDALPFIDLGIVKCCSINLFKQICKDWIMQNVSIKIYKYIFD